MSQNSRITLCVPRLVIPDVELEMNLTSTVSEPQYLNMTNTSLSDLDRDSSHLAGKSYSLGVIFGLIGAASRAGNYVTCKIIFEKKKKSTNWIILFAGFGGFLVSLASSFMDPEHLLLSDRIGEISANNWTGGVTLTFSNYFKFHDKGILLIACLGVSALFFINKALSLTSPVVVSFIRVTDIVVSYLLQVLVFHDHPSVLAILGSSFVILSVSLLSIEQYVVKQIPPGVRHLA